MIIAVTTKPKRRRPGIISFTPVPRATGSATHQGYFDRGREIVESSSHTGATPGLVLRRGADGWVS